MSEVQAEEDDEARERRSFERWATEKGIGLERRQARYGAPERLGGYKDTDTYWAWEAWKGRAKVSA